MASLRFCNISLFSYILHFTWIFTQKNVVVETGFMILVASTLGQQDCRCGVEYKPTNSGGIDYIVGGSEINIVSWNS